MAMTEKTIRRQLDEAIREGWIDGPVTSPQIQGDVQARNDTSRRRGRSRDPWPPDVADLATRRFDKHLLVTVPL